MSRVVRSLQRIAIVNRGEAATRCLRTVKTLRHREGTSLRAIALYTAVDREAPFVRHADEAIELPIRTTPVASYLDHDLLLEALRAIRADAVWPGWGFVSEDPAFVERVEASGMVFLGPSAATMRSLGDKIAAKKLAEEAQVPVTAWSQGAVADEAEAGRHAERIGYPLMIKASAGGGGRGIRAVDSPGELPEAFRSAASEALAAFGDGRLFLERRVRGGRHVEVQIAGDSAGHLLALGCRDCSVQRRHQKVIEETPPPGLATEVLEEVRAAALRITRSVGYRGIGTVEFLVTPEGFAFLEVNPRLQVEHGITEAMTGLDLVELQIRIARGESLAGLEVRERGAAIEARVCAEDPAAGFLPAPGRVARFDPALGPRIRVDSGVVAGSVIPAAFDSLIAKVIACGESRKEARARLVGALLDFDLVVEGGATNKGYLVDLLDSAPFREGGVDTGWLDREPPGAGTGISGDAADALLVAAILAYQRARDAARRRFFADTTRIVTSRIPASIGQQIELSCGGVAYRLTVRAVGAWRYSVHLDGRSASASLSPGDAHTARLAVGERTRRILYDWGESSVRVEIDGRPFRFGTQSPGQVRAETPALLVALQVAPGDHVIAGQTLGVLEAMKMEIAFRAPASGVVGEVCVRPGQQVAAGDLLLVIQPGEEPADEAPAWHLELPPTEETATVDTLREEIARVLLGYDVDEERIAELEVFLEAKLPERSSRELQGEIGALRNAVVLFADVEELFMRAPRTTRSGAIEPSNDARLRIFVRRLHAGGAGLEAAFLDRLRVALAHYGVEDLADVEPLERAVLRLLACQHTADLRHRLVLGVTRRLQALGRLAPRLRRDRDLAEALSRIAAMRSLVGDALADSALETRHALFDGPRLERRLARAARRSDAGADAPPALDGIDRLEKFDLDEIPMDRGTRCFHARSRELPEDERIFVFVDVPGERDGRGRLTDAHLAAFEIAFHQATSALRAVLAQRDPGHRLQWNRITLSVRPPLVLEPGVAEALSRRLAPGSRRLGLEKVVVRLSLLDRDRDDLPPRPVEIVITDVTGQQMDITVREPRGAPLEPATAYERRVAEARRRRLVYPYEIVRLEGGEFEEFDLDPEASADEPRAVNVAGRVLGENSSSVVFGVIRTSTEKIPEGMERVLILSDPTRGMGALAAPECDRIVAAIDLAETKRVPVEWIPVSSGARIAMDSGTENLDATARVVRRIIQFTEKGGVIHVIVHGVNVGAQSYWNALATMLPSTRGALIMTPGGSMVLTGRAALEASGAVSAEDEIAIGGFERIAGPNGEAQYYASDLAEAYRVLHDHYRFTYVVPGETAPRRHETADPSDRDVTPFSYEDCGAEGFRTVGEIFSDASNPGRKKPFAMRAVMASVIDRDGGWLERWSTWAGAETAIVWDAHLGGIPVCLIGIESRSVPRQGYRPFDGPADWMGGTLFPLSSRKIARALTAASGNRPAVILANLSGFDGSPESMRRLQLEHGAEIARAVVGFQGPILFLVVSRYHGGAYVVFSQRLNPGLRAAAFEGAYASVIGGAAAAKVVFNREVRSRAAADPRLRRLRAAVEQEASVAARSELERVTAEVTLELQARLASEFDEVHSVARAKEKGSLSDILPPSQMRPYLVAALEQAIGDATPTRPDRARDVLAARADAAP